MSAYKSTNLHHVLLLPLIAPQKPPVRKRARSGGARWVQVHQPGSRAKKARTTKSQQPACTHKEHQILTSAEAEAFAAHFLDRRPHKGLTAGVFGHMHLP